MFWRFLVINEPGVDRFLVRDADSVFSEKERRAVDQWLASDKYFHIMRDHYVQTDLIQAGMWGGVANIFPPLNQLLEKFQVATPSKMIDQLFANQFLWPTVKQSVLIHDSFYQTFGSQTLP